MYVKSILYGPSCDVGQNRLVLTSMMRVNYAEGLKRDTITILLPKSIVLQQSKYDSKMNPKLHLVAGNRESKSPIRTEQTVHGSNMMDHM